MSWQIHSGQPKPFADEIHGEFGKPWTMFTSTIGGDETSLGKALIIPPSAAIATQIGEDLEEVRFFRDDMADMAWAVEHTIENALGQPKLGHEENQESDPPASPDGAPPLPKVPPGGPQIRYQIESEVPDNWFPLIPKLLDSTTAFHILQRGVVAVNANKVVKPKGRILENGANQVDNIQEQEVPRSGVRISRAIYRTRWVDGSTHLWVARKKILGDGEGSSGIRFDQAVSNE